MMLAGTLKVCGGMILTIFNFVFCEKDDRHNEYLVGKK